MPLQIVPLVCLYASFTEGNGRKDDCNQHRIRLQKKTDRPNGVPNALYDFPEEKGGQIRARSHAE